MIITFYCFLSRYDQTYIKDNCDESDRFQYSQPGSYVLHLLGLGPSDLCCVFVRIDTDLNNTVVSNGNVSLVLVYDYAFFIYSIVFRGHFVKIMLYSTFNCHEFASH